VKTLRSSVVPEVAVTAPESRPVGLSTRGSAVRTASAVPPAGTVRWVGVTVKTPGADAVVARSSVTPSDSSRTSCGSRISSRPPKNAAVSALTPRSGSDSMPRSSGWIQAGTSLPSHTGVTEKA